MTSHEIRQAFLDFFKQRGHQIVPSAPLVVKNDPTLMFINSGMAPFKDFFLGNATPANRRIADTQKCLRVSGKHNDLEDVGLDTYHHTLFEMLGNWSFGDYFKKDAIAWAWELLTEVYKLPKDRLYVTVFEGDTKENIAFDQEAYDLWKGFIGEDRIINGSKKDNFWEMGDMGPCGPCSEIHVDLRSEEQIKQKPGKELVNTGDPLVVEIWNLVFMQFNRLADGSLQPLPDKHVDTGMGFERLCMAIQKVYSNYDTDIFQPIIQNLAKKASVKYGKNEQIDIALRVIADHIRAISFTIADGQLPSNNKAGYVIRRILRRAVRYGYTYLNFKEPFLYELVALLATQFEHVFPELKQQQDFVAKVIQEEENSFLRTLEFGIKKLENIFKENITSKTVDAKTVFELYDTFGFPVDLTALIARERGWQTDEVGFKKEMEVQKERARKATSLETSDWIEINEVEKVEFLGYDALETSAKIVKYRKVSEKNKSYYQLVLDKTPFYPEGGGQVGDTGYLMINGSKYEVIDTKKENDLIIHILADDQLFTLPNLGDLTLNATIDKARRKRIINNHTATHLLQAALKQILGTHIAQRGSLVNEDLLRFDFSHFAKLTDEEIHAVEHLVNEKIRENITLNEKRNIPIKEAIEMGATALFGEKYGDFVRVISFDKDFSTELCGGTHVQATGQIGFFKIISESSAAAGIRRIEAITGSKVEEFMDEQLALQQAIKELLKQPKDVKKAIENLLEEKNKLAKELEHYQHQQARQVKESLLQKIEDKNGIKTIIAQIDINNADVVKQIAFEIKAQVENVFLVLGAIIQDKPQLTVMISDNLVKEKNLHAGNIVKQLAKHIQGGGGGQPFYATAGGTDAGGLKKALEEAEGLVN